MDPILIPELIPVPKLILIAHAGMRPVVNRRASLLAALDLLATLGHAVPIQSPVPLDLLLPDDLATTVSLTALALCEGTGRHHGKQDSHECHHADTRLHVKPPAGSVDPAGLVRALV
jgi:hypothetical protein